MSFPHPGYSRRRLVLLCLIPLAFCIAAAIHVAGRWPQASHRPPRAPIALGRPGARSVGAPPAVEAPVFADMTADQARAFNATAPFVKGPIAPARPFLFAGSAEDRVAARTCLAAAALYEAGDDRVGEQAVAQVVLNRVRHPAFPKTVCGVVFQGAERRTGCQFTFACDGSLARPPAAGGWKRAEDIADAALSGLVFKQVGTATHYHTDWVVPYWHTTLDKLAMVHTQIFYRWHGWWGLPPAFTGRPQPFERMDPRIVALAGPEAGIASIDATAGEDGPLPPRVSLAIEGVPPRALKGNIVRLKDDAAAQYILQLDAAADPRSYAIVGFTICADKPDCLVLGWTSEAQIPRALPVLPLAQRSVAFIYRKSSVLGIAQGAWDCARFPRPVRAQCLPGTGPSRPSGEARGASSRRFTPSTP